MKSDKARELIKETFEHQFDKDRFTWFLKNLFPDKIEFRNKVYTGNYIKEAFRSYIRKYEQIGKYEDIEGNTIDLLAVELLRGQSIERARTSQRNFIAQYLKNKNHREGALAAFYSEDSNDWRFSLIKMEYSLEKKKDELTPAKRFSFLVGKDEKSHTAQNQLTSLLTMQAAPALQEVEAAFNIETVTKEFFEKYKQLFLDLNDHVEKKIKKSKQLREELESKSIDSISFTKKLLGQIVFLYFLQKKGWLGVPKDENWGKGDKKFLRSLLDKAIINKESFFGDYLVYLFYEALATEHRGGSDGSYYKKLDCRIPFLNGGLFEADYDWEKITVNIPNKFFTNKNITKEGDIGNGILDVFDRYNFTVKEDEPLEKEVAVDPEMLGKVFENLLEVKDRKSKGAFYTPREIVHYMCQESLIAYLDTSLNTGTASYQKLGIQQTDMFRNKARKGQLLLEAEHGKEIRVDKKDIEILIREGTTYIENDALVESKGYETRAHKYVLPKNIIANAKEIDKALEDIRICDPAIGSGAFPVGMMNEIVKAREILSVYLNDSKEERSVYDLKRHAIQECIYGVDIDHSAIDIAKLRLWLSLVVNEEDFYKIKPLPNLDYKIVRGNSLIGMPEGILRDAKLEGEIRELEDELFDERDKEKKDKLRKKIEKKIRQLLDSAEQFAGYKIDFDFKAFFSEVFHFNKGFDIVIANPPYISNWSLSKDNREQVLQLEDLYKDFLTGHWDIFLCFIAQAIGILKNSGVCTFILPTSFFKEKHSTKLREYFIEEMKVLELLDFEEELIFDDVARQTGIFQIKKEKVTSNNVSIKNGINLNNRLVPQHFFRGLKNYAFKLNVTNEDILIYQKLNKNSTSLGNFVCINTGVVAHARAGSPINFKKDDVIHDSFKKGYKPYIIGINISRYKIIFKGDYIDYDSKQEYFHRSKFKLLFESPKIIVRRISGKNNSIIAYYDEEKYYSNDNLMHIIQWSNEVLKYQKPEKKWKTIVNSDLSLKYILSIIASKMFTYYFSKFLSTDTLQGTYSSIYPEDLRQAPIKIISAKEQKPFITIVDKILEIKKQNPEANTTKLEKQIDVMVYHLYNLTFEEAKIIDAELTEEEFEKYKI